MRNLNLWQISVKTINIETEEQFSSCYGHYDDCAKGELYVCTSNLSVFNFDDKGNVKWNTNLSEIVPIETKPVNISFLSLSNALNVGLASGEIITVADFGTNCDVVGVCEDGLLAMEWSPEQEILILVTKTLKVIVMSCTFDPISETYLLTDEFGEKEFINVGWGKKETQFHGSEGKQAAKTKTIDVEDKPVTDERVRISWRGDGNLFCVGYNANGRRKFKVFDRDGNLQSTNENVQGLESNLSWRPSGSLIATTQKLPDKYTVSFFEKNGLKHGQFTLPVNSTTTVKELLWTTDSEVLIIQCKDETANSDIVFLYARRNYHWYLKQTLCFEDDQKINEILCETDFNSVNEKRIHVLCQNGACYSYVWNWDVDHSVGKSSNDDAEVAVIDGSKVLITGFRQTAVPPPMANIELEFDNNINSIHFIADNATDTNSFMVSHGNKLAIVQQIQKRPLEYVVSKEYKLTKYLYPFEHYNWHWINPVTLLSVSADKQNNYILNQYHIDGDKITHKGSTKLPFPVAKIQNHPTDSISVLLQYMSGEIAVYKFDNKGASLESYYDSLPVPCPDFNVVSIDGETTIIGLSHKGCLYINDKLVLNNVNSYFLHTQFLLITTLKHLLICVELSKTGISDLEVYEKNETSSSVYKRKVERGSKLVIAVPNDTRTILQMPRGNLETIQPRPLSLKIIGGYLDSLKYYEAFDLMRKQRINLNLIYDHNPKRFLSNVDVFLKTISNNSWLSLFLADLENVDVTKTMYASSYSGKDNNTITYRGTKISSICDIIRISLQKSKNSSERILPLLTTYVKKNTVEDLEQALQVIKDLKLKETNNIKLPVSADEALKYLLYLVNVDNLFDVALGMYDFDLVLLVANKSQKDPKEYIPMLNDLNEMDENYKQFNINKYLKRFKKAVECLVKCGEARYADLRTFVKYHSLYRETLTLFSSSEDIFKQISDDYGSYLKLKKQFVEAGLVYEKAGINDKAIECYKEALEWELVFKLAKNKSRDVLDTLVSELVQSLKDEKRYTEALNILEQYGQNVEETIKCAIECNKYKTAIRLCTRSDKNELIETHLVPNLLDEYDNTNELVSKNRVLYVQYKHRLQVVRENKTKRDTEGYDSFANRDTDLYSDAGSTTASSSGSGRSYRSSKNRRKHERKVASLKEGSQYEDTALVMALHTLVTSTFELRPQVKELNIALCCCNKEKDAGLLQANLETLLKEMKDDLKKIWTHELIIEATNATIAAENVPEGVSVVPQGMASLAPHMRIAPVIQDIKWKLENLY